MFPSNYKTRIPNRYPIKDLHDSFSRDKEVFETKTADALQRFGAVKFAMSVHIGLNIKVEGDKIEYLDYYNHNDERKRVLMSCADKIENCWKILITTCKAKSTIFRTTGSGWTLNKVITFCIDIVRFCPFEGSCYFDLSPRLKAKQAIMNIKNRDNECFRWALRAWTFPV